LNDAGYWQTREKLARMEARLKALGERTDLSPALRAAVERSYTDRMGQYRRELQRYEAAHPEVKATEPAEGPHAVPGLIEDKTDLFQILLEEGLIDAIPPLPDDAAADAFEPIVIEGRPISEEIIEGRR
jgi:hypothetical protein